MAVTDSLDARKAWIMGVGDPRNTDPRLFREALLAEGIGQAAPDSGAPIAEAGYSLRDNDSSGTTLSDDCKSRQFLPSSAATSRSCYR